MTTVDEVVVVLRTQREQILWPYKWAGSRGGQGAGKTTGWAYWMWDRLEACPLQNAVVVGASYSQVRDGFFNTFLNILWKHGLEEGRDYTYRRTPSPRIRFVDSGATLHAWTADIVTKIRSVNVQTLVLEEPQTWGPQAEEAWISINGRLRPNMLTAQLYPGLEPQGRMSFNTTDVGPGHWLYELIESRWPEEGEHAPGVPKYRCWQMSTRENEILLADDPGYVRNLEISMSRSRWPVEIDGEWATSGGNLYRDFNANIHTKPPEGFPDIVLQEGQPIAWALDFNVDYQCSVIVQAHIQKPIVEQRADLRIVERLPVPTWQPRTFYVVDELFLPDCGVQDVVPEFMKLYGEHAKRYGVILYGDRSGGNRSQVAGRNDIRSAWQAIVLGLLGSGVPREKIELRIQSNNPPQMDRVYAVNWAFENAQGYGVLVNPVRCRELIADFLAVRNKPGFNEIEKKTKTAADRKRSHTSDAFGYLVWVEQQLSRGNKVDFYMGR